MRFTQIPLDDLTLFQKNKIDCHRYITSRFDPKYKGNISRGLEFSFQRAALNLEVLPIEEAEEYVKYFTTDFPNDQLWSKPVVIHHIGRVGFDKVTVYTDHETRLRLEAAEQNPKPEIYFKYIVNGNEVEADNKWLVERIAYQQREERREIREFRNREANEEQGDTVHVIHGTTAEYCNTAHARRRTIEEHSDANSGTSFANLFGDSDDSDYMDSTDDTQYCKVIGTKRYKSDKTDPE